MKEQTAVEWLVEQYKKVGLISISMAEQAKEMEKEQIKDAFVECWKANMPDGYECKLSAEQYYNETFKQNKFDPNFMHEWIRNNGMRPTKEKE